MGIFTKKNMKYVVLFFTIFLLLLGCENQQAEEQTEVKEAEITVSAAASLTDALQEIQENYRAANPNVTIYFNFGASGALQQQIERGAPVDLFISASKSYIEALAQQGMIAEDEQTTLLTNELTVITAADDTTTIRDANDLLSSEINSIAIGIPETVPAGKYAKEALQHGNVWDEVESKIVQAKDVRQVLQYVETKNVEAGFVYKTDAISSDKVRIAYTVDPSFYTSIEYPVGMIHSSANKQEVIDFYTYLQSEEAMTIFKKYGFSVPGE